MNKEDKLKRLRSILAKMRRVVIAYSGGVDSTFLLYIAKDVLGSDGILAVTAASESYPSSEKDSAIMIAKEIGARYRIINTKEITNKKFRRNPINRCYYCKKELFRKLKNIARKGNYNHCVDGSTSDDLKDIRYGRIAAKEQGIRSPLIEAGLNKDDIRQFSKKARLKTWNKPSYACLASRFAYNEELTKTKFKAIEKAEEFIRSLGFKQSRVRRHGNIIRIEVESDEVGRFARTDIRNKVTKKLKALGFIYITLDLQGYRTGSMNEEIVSK
ncbi:MAG: ATP-dependent sacrificial sulfur transferase LarE, partial [Candidatus Omnitrophica bacterium]|nr:ATP-dependent sacrificial sulfur transferase LarE [Candidatus Omnitrophota bacterium]